MERCPTCGAAVRPGAKFCTSCGSRLEEPSTQTQTDESWQKPADSQETLVTTPSISADEDVTPEPKWDAATGNAITDEQSTTNEPAPADVTAEEKTATESETTTTDQADRWSSNWPEPKSEGTDDSPADRFRDALDTETTAAETTWSWRARESDTDTDTEEDRAAASSTWTPPSESDAETSVETDTVSPDIDSAGFSRPNQVASLSGDEGPTNDEIPSPTGDAPDSEARQRANALLDELRSTIWKIGITDTSGSTHKNTIQNMSRIRGETNDFSDLESTISAVQDNPRDIDALRDLGQQADRLRALLDSHTRLVTTLEDAINDQ